MTKISAHKNQQKKSLVGVALLVSTLPPHEHGHFWSFFKIQDQRIEQTKTMIFFFRLKCEFVGIDIQDDQGRHEVGMVENTIKTPLGLGQEGCLFESVFHINKVTNYMLCNSFLKD